MYDFVTFFQPRNFSNIFQLKFNYLMRDLRKDLWKEILFNIKAFYSQKIK